jgi:hypothetical protein
MKAFLKVPGMPPGVRFDQHKVAYHVDVMTIIDSAYSDNTTPGGSNRAVEKSAPEFDIETGLPLIRACIFNDDDGPFAGKPVLQLFMWFIILSNLRICFRVCDMSKSEYTNHVRGRARAHRCVYARARALHRAQTPRVCSLCAGLFVYEAQLVTHARASHLRARPIRSAHLL